MLVAIVALPLLLEDEPPPGSALAIRMARSVPVSPAVTAPQGAQPPVGAEPPPLLTPPPQAADPAHIGEAVESAPAAPHAVPHPAPEPAEPRPIEIEPAGTKPHADKPAAAAQAGPARTEPPRHEAASPRPAKPASEAAAKPSHPGSGIAKPPVAGNEPGKAVPAAPKDATKPPGVALPPPADHHFYVQLAALADAAKADELKNRAGKTGVSVFTDRVGALTRVRVGPFASREAALAAQQKLAGTGIPGQVIER